MRLESLQLRFRPGITRPEAILAFVRCVTQAAAHNPAFEACWRSLMTDGTVFLSLTDWSRPYLSVAAFARCTPMLGGGLILSIDIHIPVGLFNDTTHYRVEQSTSYIRSTQQLHPVLKITQRDVHRASIQRERLGESGVNRSATEEMARLHEDTVSQLHATRREESSGQRKSGWDVQSWTSSQYAAEDRRDSAARVQISNRAANRSEESRTTRERASGTEDITGETVRERSFHAVGPDLTTPSNLLACWLANPENVLASALVTTLVHSAAGLVEAMSDMVERARVAANIDGLSTWNSDGLDARFWEAAAELIAIEARGCPVNRTWLRYDGSLRPIDGSSLVHQRELDSRSLTDIRDPSRLLPPQAPDPKRFLIDGR
jgi:hypothetical protein